MSSNAAAVSPDTAQNPEPHKPQSLYQKKRHTSDIVLFYGMVFRISHGHSFLHRIRKQGQV